MVITGYLSPIYLLVRVKKKLVLLNERKPAEIKPELDLEKYSAQTAPKNPIYTLVRMREVKEYKWSLQRKI